MTSHPPARCALWTWHARCGCCRIRDVIDGWGAIRVPPDVWQAVRRRAWVEECTLTNLATRAIRQYLDHVRDETLRGPTEPLMIALEQADERHDPLFARNDPRPKVRVSGFTKCARPGCGHLFRSHLPTCFWHRCHCEGFVDPYAEVGVIAALIKAPTT
jgi:hypothetical protein